MQRYPAIYPPPPPGTVTSFNVYELQWDYFFTPVHHAGDSVAEGSIMIVGMYFYPDIYLRGYESILESF